MEQEQHITSKADLRKWRIELPNLYDDSDLDPYEFRLLVHYVRVGNCYEGTRTTATKCKMSAAQVVEKRRSLETKGFIKLGESNRGTISIEIVDIWAKNFKRYSTRLPREQTRLPREQTRSRGERKKELSKERTIEESSGSKNEPPALIEQKPKTKSPATEKAIAIASDALQEFGKKNDVQVDLGTAVADPRKAERVFVNRFKQMIAAIFPYRGEISDDTQAAKRIYALRVDEEWLSERLSAYTNGAGDEFKKTDANSFWVWKRIEKEWSIYRKEKADAEQREREQADYERRVAAAFASVSPTEQDSGRAHADSVHLHDTARGPGGDARGDAARQAGVAVDAGGELRVRGDGLGVLPVSQPQVGAADGQMGVAGEGRSLREMLRDYRMRRHLAAVDAEIPKHERAAT